MTHKIRLNGPWELCRKTENGQIEVLSRLKMPSTLVEIRNLAAENSHNLCLRRWFNCPTNLTFNEQVWVSVQHSQIELPVRVNEQPLGRCVGNWQAELTALLQPRNELLFELPSLEEIDCPDGFLWEEVALVIQATSC